MPSPVPESGSTSVDRGQQYKDDKAVCNKECNQVANTNQGGTLDTWSGLNLDQLRLEWSGTDPSSKEYTVCTYLPRGLNPSDLSISIDERTRMLSMQCQKKDHREQKDQAGNYYMSQDSEAFTQRAFTLPDDVDLAGIKAIKDNQGGFSLHLPKITNQGQQLQGGVKQITIQ